MAVWTLPTLAQDKDKDDDGAKQAEFAKKFWDYIQEADYQKKWKRWPGHDEEFLEVYRQISIQLPKRRRAVAIHSGLSSTSSQIMRNSPPSVDPNKWLENHGDVMYAYALSQLRNQDAAEEVVQEAFLGALRNVETLSNQSSEGAWLMGILKKKVVDRIRAKSKAPLHLKGEDQVVSRLFDENGNWSDAARQAGSLRLDSLEQSEFRELFELCLETLPDKQSTVFVLKEVQERATEDVCKELGISSTNLWVLMHRARLRLAECIKTRWSTGDV